ncbi:MAG TPA: NADH:flavin oxidoreductase [Dongiaceae bacterium]|nr:NADH:flavin oxidoreductase [Dongiaceae bacterium]
MADPLLQPFQLKHLTLKNRVISTSHEPAYSEEALPKARYRLYHEEKAKGGIGMTMIGGSSIVAPDSPQAFGNLYVGSDAIIPWFKELTAGVHKYGAAVMCQITHLGRRTSWSKEHWLPVIAPSSVREPAHRCFPKEMEDWDFTRVVSAYGAAARRCRDGGMDGIEIEAYGHLFDAFWSPNTNERADEYGTQSLENRLRFSFDVLREIRRQAGADYIVGLRMVVDETIENGLTKSDGLAIAQRMAESGLIDFINVIQGYIGSDEAISHVIPGMGTPAGPHLDLAREVKRLVKLPVMQAARVNDVATARHAITSGAVDLIGMTRAHMADPHIVAKIMRGEEQRIRPCVGAGYCIDRLYQGAEALCLHNPATSREATMPHVITPTTGAKKKVVVVGAGPAGLEAARVSAARGHQVVLFEAADKPGGQVLLAAKLQRRREILGIVDWLAAEVALAGVDCRFNRYAEASDVLAENPDIVVIATGGLPNAGRLKFGAELATSPWDILAGQVPVAPEVLLFDDHGAHEGLTLAEFAVNQGARLDYVSPERAAGIDIGGINYPAYFKALYAAKTTFTLNHRLKGIRRDGNKLVAVLANDYDKSETERRTDQVIAEHGTLPAAEVYFELKDGSANRGEIDIDALIANRPQALARNKSGRFQLFRVGDAVSSRNIHAALYESLRLCLQF